MKMETEKAIEYWERVHEDLKHEEIKIDDWLDKFEDIIEKCKTPVIDLGCGRGNDTLYLIQKGKSVISCDYSQNAIRNINNNFPEVLDTKCFDMQKGLPFADNSSELIIADLSLHYFREKDTFKIINEIKRVLTKGGHLLFRVNSVNDVNHGAGQGKKVEEHLYMTSDNRLKRFFDENDIRYFFKDFEVIYSKEETMGRYDLAKVLYTVCVRKR